MPQFVKPRLRLEHAQFAVLTSAKFSNMSARHTRESLSLQGARVQSFSEQPDPGMTLLPVAARLEAEHRRVFIGQKQLELLFVLGASMPPPPRPPRWYVIVDDDSFLFVHRLVDMLARLDDTQPLLVGGAQGQSSLCGAAHLLLQPGGCHPRGSAHWREQDAAFINATGRRPVLRFHAGGLGYALSAPALRRMHAAIRQRRCPDAAYSDAATAACALTVGVRQLTLPAGWINNNERGRASEFGKSFYRGRLVSYHRLKQRQALCWARLAAASPPDTLVECDQRCNLSTTSP